MLGMRQLSIDGGFSNEDEMAKTTGKGRGGARPGAGRPRKIQPVEAPKSENLAAQSANSAPEKPSAGIDITSIAQKAALKGVKRLEGIIRDGSAADAIKATKELLAWGFVKPELAKAAASADRYQPGQHPEAPKAAEPKPPELGIKEIRKKNAEEATSAGTYAVPRAPRLAVDNG